MKFTQIKGKNMDNIYGSKKYFQSLGTTDNDYYNRHSSGNRALVSSKTFFFLFRYLNEN